MKRLFTLLVVVLTMSTTALRAQEEQNTSVDYIPDISLDARFDYSHDFAEKAGRFGGTGLYIDLNGQISPNLSYSLNHCIAKWDGADELGFGNTNWLTLTYENDKFFVTAGKEDVKVGSFEYDAYDLDSYWEMNSLFWNSFSPWQWGVSAGCTRQKVRHSCFSVQIPLSQTSKYSINSLMHLHGEENGNITNLIGPPTYGSLTKGNM